MKAAVSTSALSFLSIVCLFAALAAAARVPPVDLKQAAKFDCDLWIGCLHNLYVEEKIVPGEGGECVKLMQQEFGMSERRTTSTFDNVTKLYVHRFQRQHHLPVVDFVDVEMWIVLGEGKDCPDAMLAAAGQQLLKGAASQQDSAMPTAPLKAAPCKDAIDCTAQTLQRGPLKLGDYGVCVSVLERMLGMPAVPDPKKFDGFVLFYVHRFQVAHGLDYSDEVDSDMWDTLYVFQKCGKAAQGQHKATAAASAA